MDDISINVSDGEKIAEGFIANKNEIVELSPSELLQIQSIKGSRNKGIQISIGGLTKSTRVHVIATHFIPNAKNVYLKQRTIGEEYRYVLERQTAAQFIG